MVQAVTTNNQAVSNVHEDPEVPKLVREVMVANPYLMMNQPAYNTIKLFRGAAAWLAALAAIKTGEVRVLPTEEETLYDGAFAPNLPPNHPINMRSTLWNMPGLDWDSKRKEVLDAFERRPILPVDKVISLGGKS